MVSSTYLWQTAIWTQTKQLQPIAYKVSSDLILYACWDNCEQFMAVSINQGSDHYPCVKVVFENVKYWFTGCQRDSWWVNATKMHFLLLYSFSVGRTMTQWFALLGCLSRNVWSVLILALIMMVALTRSQCSRLEDICTDPFIGRQSEWFTVTWV